jgi:hypothetical protein
MTTKAEMIELLKAEFPTLRVGDDENGYTDLDDNSYNSKIEEWADNRLLKEKKAAEAEAAAVAKADSLAKLAALGIDTKALGL